MNEDFLRWMVCGAGAGLAVDLTLYPLDTLKTRLQSKQGFIAAGGFRNIYSGMGSVAVGSAPGSALFFLSYRTLNGCFQEESAFVHALSASSAETIACIVRVPTELVKQRLQASMSKRSLSQVCSEIYRSNNLLGFYRGYCSTVAREIPFSIIEFPLWEFLKKTVALRKQTEMVVECFIRLTFRSAPPANDPLSHPLPVPPRHSKLSLRRTFMDCAVCQKAQRRSMPFSDSSS